MISVFLSKYRCVRCLSCLVYSLNSSVTAVAHADVTTSSGQSRKCVMFFIAV